MGIARVVLTTHFTSLFCSVAVNTLVRVLVGLVMDKAVSREEEERGTDGENASPSLGPDSLSSLAVEAEVAAVLSRGLGREVLAAVDGFLERGVPVIQGVVASALTGYLLEHPLDLLVDEAELGNLTGDVRLAVEAAWAGIQVPTEGETPHPLAAMVVAAIGTLPLSEDGRVEEVINEAKDLLESHQGGVAIQASLDLVFAVSHAKLRAVIKAAPEAKVPLVKLLKPVTELAKDSTKEGSEVLQALFGLEAVKNFTSTTLCG